MNTIGQCLGLHTLLHLTDTLRNGAVGKQHKLLDEFVGILRHLEITPYRLSILVDIEMQFLTIKLHCSVLESRLTQLLRQLVELLQ